MEQLAKSAVELGLPADTKFSEHDREIIDGLARVQTNIIRKMGSRRSEAIRKAGLSALAVAFGIATDKRAQLMGRVSTKAVHHTHTLVNDDGQPISRQQLNARIERSNKKFKGGNVDTPEYVDTSSKVVDISKIKRIIPLAS